MEATTSTDLVLPLSALGPATLPLVGGKAARLGELMAAGLRVPAGFAVTTTAWDLALREAGATRAVSEAGAALSSLAPEEVPARAGALRERIRGLPLPGSVREALGAAWRRLEEATPGDTDGPLRVAVRSSGTAEDLPEASFAGQHDTVLGVADPDALEAALLRVWASLYTDRAVLYRRRIGLPQDAVAPAVVVQRLLPANRAGVLFTVDPLTGARGRFVVEACLGLGEGLVSGRADPDRFVLDASDLEVLDERVVDKPSAVHLASDGEGVEERPVEEDAAATPALDRTQLRSLGEAAQQIREAFPGEHDIEWAFVGDALYVLQDRPVTLALPALPPPEHRVAEVYLWSRSNFEETVPAPPTPLGESLITDLLQVKFRPRSVRVPMPEGYHPVERIRGRPYWNLTPLLHDAWWADWILERWLDLTDRRSGAVVRSMRGEGIPTRWPISVAAAARFLLGWVAALPLRALPILRRLAAPRGPMERLEDAVDAAVVRFQPDGETLNLSPVEQWGEIEALRELWLHGRLGREIHMTFMASMMTVTALIRVADRWLGHENPGTAGFELASGAATDETQRMSARLWSLGKLLADEPEVRRRVEGTDADTLLEELRAVHPNSRFLRGLEDFLERYGHRARAEELISAPRWREDRSEPVATLLGYLRMPAGTASPRDRLRRARRQWLRRVRAADAALREGSWLPGLGRLRARVLRALLRRARVLFPFRENIKQHFFRLFGCLRDRLRVLGDRLHRDGALARPDDLFFLDFEEAGAWIRAGCPDPDQKAHEILGRRAARERARGQPAPFFLRSDGEPVEPASAGQDEDDQGREVLTGQPASSGRCEGTVRVVRDPREVGSLGPDTVLVVPAADPGWTPLLLRACGMVMEVGGAVSHAAIVAREYGVPTVVGLRGATEELEDGDRVALDGGTGRVTVLERHEVAEEGSSSRAD